MRVLLIGASGFVGRWLAAELGRGGHTLIELPLEIDVVDADALAPAIAAARPDAVAHLAAVAFAPDAAADPVRSFDVAVGGTINVIEGLRRLTAPPVLLVTGSAEVYGTPDPADLPLRETSLLRPRTPYALSKAAQEAVALAYAARFGLRAVVTRSFNHFGPGQRPDFVVPALCRRVHDFANGRSADIAVGNVDVRRDFADVRDVVRAYRLLLEAGAAGRLASGGAVVNVCSGNSFSIRTIIDELAGLAGVYPVVRVDEALVRPHDALEIRGDHALLSEITGWQPQVPLSDTLRDVWLDITSSTQGLPAS